MKDVIEVHGGMVRHVPTYNAPNRVSRSVREFTNHFAPPGVASPAKSRCHKAHKANRAPRLRLARALESALVNCARVQRIRNDRIRMRTSGALEPKRESC